MKLVWKNLYKHELSLQEEKIYIKMQKNGHLGGFTPFDCQISSNKFFCDALKVRLSVVIKTNKKTLELKDFWEVLHHLTAKFHLKTFSVMHSK